jgi:aminoacylase
MPVGPAGDVTTLNLTVLKAGMSTDGGKTFAFNVVPNEAEAGFDIRVPPSVPSADVTAMLDEW